MNEWKLVPVEPTVAMVQAAIDAYDGPIAAYQAMLAAAPPAPSAVYEREWTLISPDGRRFIGATKFAALKAETDSRLSPEQQIENIKAAMRDDPLTPSAEPVISKDAYDGAREDLAIWKKRALEAEALNRRFADAINGPTFMGEPAPSAEPADAQVEAVVEEWFAGAEAYGSDFVPRMRAALRAALEPKSC